MATVVIKGLIKMNAVDEFNWSWRDFNKKPHCLTENKSGH